MVRRMFYPGVTPAFILLALFSFTAAPGMAQRFSIELLEAKGAATQTTITIEGQVKNISGKDLSGVTVYCDFQNASGKVVRTEQGSLETDPLPPDKTSAFKCSTKSGPEIRGYSFRFVSLFGGVLAAKDSRKK